MSNIKSARADFVKSGDQQAIMVTMHFDEGDNTFFIADPRVIKAFDDNADNALTAALFTVSITQGSPMATQVYKLDQLKGANEEDQAFVEEARRVLKEQVAIAEWTASAKAA